MAVIGQINTVISATTQPLTSSLGKAAVAVQGFGAKLKAVAASAAPLLAPIAAITAAVKSFTAVSSQFGDIDAIAKYARATGQTVDEVVGLQHAANLTGVEIGMLEKATKLALRQGLSLSDVADEVAAIADPAEQARVAFDRLGKTGQELVPFLSQGGDTIRDMVAEGAELSGFSMADAMKIEEANDAFARMQAVFTGLARDIAISIAPMIDIVSQKMQAFGKFTRQVFGYISPLVVQFGNLATTAFNTAWSFAERLFGGIVADGVSAFETVIDYALDFMITAEFAFNNIDRIADYAWKSMQLGMMQLWGEIKHTFTERIPKTIAWFGQSWRDIMFTSVDYALTLLINLGANIRKVWSGVLDFIAGRGFNVDFTPLSEGFVNTISNLPDIGERELSAAEKMLSQSVSTLGEQLQGDLAEHLRVRRAELFDKKEVAETRAVIGLDEDFAEAVTNKIDELAGPRGLERGSAEAFSAIFAAMRGDSVQDKMLAAAQAGVVEAKKQTAQLIKIASNPPADLAVATL